MKGLEELKAELEELGQGHVFAQLADELQDIEHPVVQQLLRLNVAESLNHLRAASNSTFTSLEEKDIRPLQQKDVLDWATLPSASRDQVTELGMAAIRGEEVRYLHVHTRPICVWVGFCGLCVWL